MHYFSFYTGMDNSTVEITNTAVEITNTTVEIKNTTQTNKKCQLIPPILGKTITYLNQCFIFLLLLLMTSMSKT